MTATVEQRIMNDEDEVRNRPEALPTATLWILSAEDTAEPA